MKLTPCMYLCDPDKPEWSPAFFRATTHSVYAKHSVYPKNSAGRRPKKFMGLLLILFLFVLSPAGSFAQGWQMYIDEIKQDAATRRVQKNAGKGNETSLPADSSSSRHKPVPERDFSNVTPTDTAASQAPKNTSVHSAHSAKNETEGSSVQQPETKSDGKTSHSARASAASGEGAGKRRLLDFSEALGEKPQQWTEGELTLKETAASEVPWAPSLVSCRNLPELRADATLNDVFFCTPLIGWAVGDRGTILYTSDGGMKWNMIATGIEANLYSVHFVDPQWGIIVGGSLLPGVANGCGIILHTKDGGKNWRQVTTGSFPILRRVRFLNRQRGWIAGDSSELYSGGLFASEDGGETFLPVSSNRHAGWKHLEFDMNEGNGIGLGTDGTIQRASRTLSLPVPVQLGNRRCCDLIQVRPDDPIRVVGEGAIVMESRDGGTNWSQLGLTLPPGVSDCFDFNTVFAGGDTIFVAGSPGTFIFSSQDGGKSWRATASGVRVPIRRMTFIDSTHGWCVGELGMILATADGGATWHVQRSGGSRLALLGFFGSGNRIPYEAFIRFAADEGYLSRVHLAVREENREKKTDEVPWFLCVNEAMISAGADGIGESGLFVLDSNALQTSVKDIIDRFDRENDSKGMKRFREQLVRQIRLWQPSVLVVEDPAFSPFSQLLDQELPRAIQSAGDPLAYPEHMTVAGLKPWSVSRAYRYLANSNTNSNANANTKEITRISTAVFCPSLGRSVGELSFQTRALLGQNISQVQDCDFALLFDANKATDALDAKDANFFAGLNIPYGSDCRRSRQKGLLDRREELDQRDKTRRHNLAIIQRYAMKENARQLTGEILISQINQMIRGTDPEQALEYLLTLGRRFHEQGNWSAAEEVYSMAALKFPTHPLVREALLWLVQYYAGSESYWRNEAKNRWTNTEATLGRGGDSSTRTRRAIDTSQTSNRARNVSELGKMIRQFHPELYMTPEIRFPLAMIQRKRGQTRSALQYYFNRSCVSKNDLWGIRARAEYWLLAPNKDALPEGERLCPSLIMSCRATSVKPFLDGVLEENVWNAAQSVSLSTQPLQEGPASESAVKSADLAWQEENKKLSRDLGSFVSLLYDNEYLYIGITCKKAQEYVYEDTKEKPRKRDTDSPASDRIELQFDLDRDYTSTWKFAFDYRGWVWDSAWNDISWNPTVFVAQKADAERWTLEIAIPLEELCQSPPSRADVWLISARRVVPGVGLECWNVANSLKGADGFGFLTFGF